MRYVIGCLILIFLGHLAPATRVRLAPLSSQQECPTINVESLRHTCAGEKAIFRASVARSGFDFEPTFNWTVSEGNIVSGQGTDTITVETANASPNLIHDGLKATVEIGGLTDSLAYCSRTAYYTDTVIVCGHATKYDEFGDLTVEGEREHLDSLALELENKEYVTALIFAYAGRRARMGEAEARLIRVKNYLISKHHIKEERVVTLDGGHREDLTFEVWTLPPKTPPVEPTPTVAPADVEIISDPPNNAYH